METSHNGPDYMISASVANAGTHTSRITCVPCYTVPEQRTQSPVRKLSGTWSKCDFPPRLQGGRWVSNKETSALDRSRGPRSPRQACALLTTSLQSQLFEKSLSKRFGFKLRPQDLSVLRNPIGQNLARTKPHHTVYQLAIPYQHQCGNRHDLILLRDILMLVNVHREALNASILHHLVKNRLDQAARPAPSSCKV